FASAEEARVAGLALLREAWDGRGAVRLLGLGFADLEEERCRQGELFAEDSERRRKAEEAVFEIERRGLGSLRRARIIRPAPRGGCEDDASGGRDGGPGGRGRR
ncbi:MAG: hypothetical protein JNG85_06290, partial [Spirochaetaceae bacterium]|nr:hypothetical protein [Spirochaetaceae bacterium]